jgi:hypothetical protein
MSIKCNVCYAWQPKDWQGWKWADTVARCEIKDKFVCHNETCESGSLVRPNNAVVRINRVTKAPIKKPVAPSLNVPKLTGELFQLLNGGSFPLPTGISSVS